MARVTEAQMARALAIYESSGRNYSEVARQMGITKSAALHRVKSAVVIKPSLAKQETKDFVVQTLPDEELSADEILAYRKKVFAQRSVAEAARKLIPVKVKMGGPIGVAHFGDPHVDDDGCDIETLEAHMKIARDTEGLFGANLGDLQNNWVGRLSRLWANQSTSSGQAWKLVEWMVKSVNWLYIVGGNHDAWSGTGDPVKWMMKDRDGVYEMHGARMALVFPNGKSVRVNARHDFSGHSMWNPAHGPMKAVQGGWRDHILTCGHKHVSFVGGPLKDPSTGLLSWSIRCAGYKVHDNYAKQEGLPDQNAFPACVTIIDPEYADDDSRLITVIPNVAEGAEFLKWKRSRWGRAKSR